MAQVIVTESSLQNIAGAIRSKLGTQDTYTPSEMAGAISQIHGDPVLEALSVNANGTYIPSSGKDGFSQAVVNVPNSYSSGDEGKVVSGGALVAQSSQSITQNGTYDTTLKNQAIVNVPNSYSASDEGKVVNNGALVAQSSQTIRDNGTYDTTLKNQVTVNVSGGGGDSDAFTEYDFTKLSGTYRGVQYGLNGAIFSTQTNCIGLATPKINDITIEVDIASMQLASGTHRRLLMPTYNNGFIYRSTGIWAFYNGNWYDSQENDGAFLDNCKLSVYIDSSNLWHFYKDGTLFFEPTGALGLSNTNTDLRYGAILLGSYDGNAINNATIRGVKIYDGNHIS